MKRQRTFSPEFRRQVVEELLSEISTSVQLCRRHNISSGLLYYWKKQYAKGHFGNEPTQKAAKTEKIRQLEQMVGKLTMENEFLKKAVQNSLCQSEKKGVLCLLNKFKRSHNFIKTFFNLISGIACTTSVQAWLFSLNQRLKTIEIRIMKKIILC